MKKILFLLVLMFLYSCAWAQSADWKTCTLKASKVVTYQNGSKTNETKSNISITIDKPNYTIRVGNQMCYVEGKEVLSSKEILFQCHTSQSSEKYVIAYNAKTFFILVGKQKDESAPMYKYYYSTDKKDIILTY